MTESKSLVQQLNDRARYLEAAYAPNTPSSAQLLKDAADRIAELEAARTAYASEFPPNADGEPDVGNVHANIRAMKSEHITLMDAIRVVHDKVRYEDDCGPAGYGWQSDELSAAWAVIDAAIEAKENP